MNIIDVIKDKISKSLCIKKLKIVDISEQHKGHNFISDLPVSHVKITVISDDFKGLSIIKRHKLLYEILASEIKLLHAISFDLRIS